MSEPLDDGWGNQWIVCDDPRCDLQIVRPGKVQCSRYCDDIPSIPTPTKEQPNQ